MGPEILALMIPIVVLMIPIVAILTSHQQKMAKIIHEGRSNSTSSEIEALRQEIRELKQLVHQQSIAIDSFGARPAAPPKPESIEHRLNA
jgi:predicted PurR-regulated permease PerM